jgi:hypothetical protein
VRKSFLRLSFLWLALALALTACPVLSETLPPIQSADGFVTLQGISKPADSIAPAQLAHIRSAISANEKRKARRRGRRRW